MRDSLLLVMIAMLCFIKADLVGGEMLVLLWNISGASVLLINLIYILIKKDE